MLDYRFYYRRNLPHYQPAGGTFFITFRLSGSIPICVLQQLTEEHERIMEELRRLSDPCERGERIYEEQRRAFGRWDAALHQGNAGPRWLEDPKVAALVADSLRYRDDRVYRLDAFCLMPNHAHVIFAPLQKGEEEYSSLASIMHSLKLHTARQANSHLNRKGDFWQHENYDHAIRDEKEYRRIIEYVLNNPVKAGLANEWQDWPWNYVNPAL